MYFSTFISYYNLNNLGDCSWWGKNYQWVQFSERIQTEKCILFKEARVTLLVTVILIGR